MHTKPRGSLLLDAAMALALLGAEVGLVAMASERTNHTVEALDHHQTLVQIAQQTLHAVQAGRPLPHTGPNVAITTRRLEITPPSNDLRWVSVDVKSHHQDAVVDGLVPANRKISR